jgi:hypothetical protein
MNRHGFFHLVRCPPVISDCGFRFADYRNPRDQWRWWLFLNPKSEIRNPQWCGR